MFRQYRWDVKPLLKVEGNELRIDLESVVRHAAQKQAVRGLPGVSQAIAGGPHVRKRPASRLGSAARRSVSERHPLEASTHVF
jgi:hypothetical protein